MKFISLTLLLLPLFFSVSGQVQQISQEDSVRQLAESYHYAEAIELADRYLAEDSTRIDILRLKAKALQAWFQNQRAIEVYEQIYKLDTLQLSGLNDLVNANRLTGQYEIAATYCEKITNLFPENIYFKTQLAHLYYLDNQFELALEVLKPLYQADTTNLYFIRQVANSYASLGKTDSAIIFYQSALLLDSMDVLTTVKLSNQYIIKKAYDTALIVAERFLKVDSSNADVTKQQAYCCYLLRDYPKAQAQFERSINLGDKSKLAYKYLGLSYYKVDEFAQAEPWFREAYGTDTTDAEVCFYYGVSAIRAINPDTGIIMLNKTLESLLPLTSFISTVYVQLSEGYNILNNSDTALYLLKRAYEQNPAETKLLFRIGYHYDLHMKNEEMALLYYEKYLNATGTPETTNAEPSLSFAFSFSEYAAARVREIKGLEPNEKGSPGEPDDPIEP